MDVVNEKIKPLVGSSNENVEPPATKEDVERPAKRKCKKRVNGNLCHGCGQYGVNHDKRNYPKLHNRMAPVDQNVT
ncbi:hypothetical protein PS1_023406 [Malus domestica]